MWDYIGVRNKYGRRERELGNWIFAFW